MARHFRMLKNGRAQGRCLFFFALDKINNMFFHLLYKAQVH